MRNLFFVIILAIAYLICGVFVVDSKEVGVVYYNPTNIAVYHTGIHWKTPLYGDLEYINKTTRVSYSDVANPYQFKDGSSANASIVIVWQVSDFAKYRLLNDDKTNKFNQQFVAAINQIVTDKAKSCNKLLDFIVSINSIHGLPLANLGVNLVSLNLVNIKTNELQKSANLANLSAESAYDYAHQVKSQAESAQQAVLNNMKQANNKFYTYYMTINAYQESAKSRADVPPLTSILAK